MLHRVLDLAIFYECGNKPSACIIKREDFVGQLSEYWLLKKDSTCSAKEKYHDS